MKVWVNVSYTAPSVVDTRSTPGNLREAIDPENSEADLFSLSKETYASVYPNPAASDVSFEFSGVAADAMVDLQVFDISGRELFHISATPAEMAGLFNSRFRNLRNGVYHLKLNGSGLNQQIRLLKSE